MNLIIWVFASSGYAGYAIWTNKSICRANILQNGTNIFFETFSKVFFLQLMAKP